MAAEPEYLTPTEAARLARVTTQTIRRHADAGLFPAIRVGPKLVRIPRHAFIEWLWGPEIAAKESS